MSAHVKLLVALTALLLTACGGSTSTATGGSGPTPSQATATSAPQASPSAAAASPCLAFTAADAQSLLGVPVGTGAEVDGPRSCGYKSRDGAKYANVVIKSASAYQAIAASFGLTIPVSAVGDAALRKSDGTSLLAHNSNISVLVSVNPTLADTKSSTIITAAEVEIAKKVLATA